MLAQVADADDGDARLRSCRRPRPTIADAGLVRPPRRTASPSSTSVLPASIDSADAPATRIAWIVATPITGTSNRMSCFGLATLTMRTPGPARCPARAITSSVPSIASTATTAWCLTAIVWPMSRPAMASAMR